jgi:hypothetical protein
VYVGFLGSIAFDHCQSPVNRKNKSCMWAIHSSVTVVVPADEVYSVWHIQRTVSDVDWTQVFIILYSLNECVFFSNEDSSVALLMIKNFDLLIEKCDNFL